MDLETLNPQTQDPSSTPNPTVAPATTAPAFDATTLAQALKDAGVGQPPPVQRAAPTQAEIDSAMEVYKPTRAQLKALKAAMEADDTAPDDEVLAPLHGLRDGLSKQSAAFTKAGLQAIVEHFTGQLAPIMQYVQQQQHAATSGNFFKSYPELEQHPEIVKAVAASLTQSGQKPASQQEAFKLLAESTAAVIKKLNPAFALSTPSSPNTQATPKLASLSTGTGQGGAGSTPMKGKGGASDIWEPV